VPLGYTRYDREKTTSVLAWESALFGNRLDAQKLEVSTAFVDVELSDASGEATADDETTLVGSQFGSEIFWGADGGWVDKSVDAVDASVEDAGADSSSEGENDFIVVVHIASNRSLSVGDHSVRTLCADGEVPHSETAGDTVVSGSDLEG